MKTHCDVVVVGAGVIGTMTAKELAERGRSTLLLERRELGNAHGSSHGLNRIVRVTDYHPDYVRLNRLALRKWADLQDEAGEALLVRTGNLEIGEGAQPYADALEAAGEAFEWLAPEQARERWPGLMIRHDERLFVQEDGGVCLADRTVRAAARLASAAGAELREGAKVERVIDHDTFAEVVVDGTTVRSSVVVVTAGAWAGGLLPLGCGYRSAAGPHARAGFVLPAGDAVGPSHRHRLHGGRGDGSLRGPAPDGDGSLQARARPRGSRHRSRPSLVRSRPRRLARVEAWGRDRFSAMIPTEAPETCLYTNTPDNDYVLDRVGAIVIGSPCSGHGFKASPMIGSLLADLATRTPPAIPVERFLASRPALRT